MPKLKQTRLFQTGEPGFGTPPESPVFKVKGGDWGIARFGGFGNGK